jgi:hypothetical protein
VMCEWQMAWADVLGCLGCRGFVGIVFVAVITVMRCSQS